MKIFLKQITNLSVVLLLLLPDSRNPGIYKLDLFDILRGNYKYKC